MIALLMIAGIVIVALGIALSIALHEIGHLLPAKLFKVRVTQYMVGFGPTLWSRRRGETEYGVKAIPLGGYVAMIGMYPPPDETGTLNHPAEGEHESAENPAAEDAAPKDHAPRDPYLREVGAQYGAPATSSPAAGSEGGSGTTTKTVRSQSTGIFQQLSTEAREVAAEDLRPGDEDRMFYRLPIWKRIIIMLGGPAMNGLIALALTAGIISFHGTAEPNTTVREVFECVVSADAADAGQTECTDEDPAGPAFEAGLRPGDQILAFNGEPVATWDELTALIRESADESSEVSYVRDGEETTTTLTPILTERPISDGLGRAQRDDDGSLITEPVGFIGMGADQEIVQQPFWEAGPTVWEQSKAVGAVVANLPVRLYDVAVSTFTSAERDPDGPLSVVGVGRIAGELSAQEEIPLESRFASLISLVAGVNVALMVFNLIPLLPLDGGHVAGALYEGLRRRLAKLLGRPDPGPFDISKLLPLTYVVAGMLLVMGVLLIYADIVNPIRLFD
ncbi:site-2 protease family protein [Nesterenkonia sp. E16_7]|uniref:M50 family metallopeptidase n=1 Tax=unclassified Nesterenkonia TaxID=2629769 RepID=UPI001A938DC4|nr:MULTISPECIES: site-2 protease family protein [unclassified Nesterenkonia]MBO0595632.1 site-2 protease family protein [Nesterenkonia sp. E16_10]MBO0598561.1 site-2 protease family protein [Nesterenkonia sp. E16_7]